MQNRCGKVKNTWSYHNTTSFTSVCILEDFTKKDFIELRGSIILLPNYSSSCCKVSIDSSAANVRHELLHQYGEYGRYETLDSKVLNRFKCTECRSPLIVPATFNKEYLEMMKLTQACISKGILKIHPSMEEVIISLKSAKNKPANPYTLDKNARASAYHYSLDALRLSLSCLKFKGN